MTMWRQAQGFKSYEISNDGRVRRAVDSQRYKTGYELTPKPHRNGYRYFILNDDEGKPQTRLGHRLVLEAFVGPCPDGMEACHNNGDRTDNRIENLRWDTAKANQADRRKHGTDLRGEALPYAKLTAEKVREIRKRAEAGEKQTVLAKEFGVGDPQIHRIIKRERWAHV